MSKKKNHGYRNQNQGNRQQNGIIPITQDHKKPQQNTGKKFRTLTGFEYTIQAKNIQDMRFLDALVSMEDPALTEAERVVSMVRVIRMMLGEEQKEALYAHVTKLHGWADPAAVGAELKSIISNFDESKKK